MFTPRTTPVEKGTKPYAWDVDSVYECTWFCYFRSLEAMSCTPPCWWDRATQTGSYTDAKEWLKNFREPWEVKGVDYVPVAGDIAVFDGEYGHVQFMETDVMYSEYRKGDPNSFRNGKFEKSSNLLGFLHYPLNNIEPVERNTAVTQIQTTDMALRIRTKPSLDGEIVGHVLLGYYNVLQEAKADGYTWYEIAKDRWCADITTVYLPSDESNIIKEIEKYFEAMKQEINVLTDANSEMKKKLTEIHKISDVKD